MDRSRYAEPLDRHKFVDSVGKIEFDTISYLDGEQETLSERAIDADLCGLESFVAFGRCEEVGERAHVGFSPVL